MEIQVLPFMDPAGSQKSVPKPAYSGHPRFEARNKTSLWCVLGHTLGLGLFLLSLLVFFDLLSQVFA